MCIYQIKSWYFVDCLSTCAVLAAGGNGGTGDVLASAELYDPSTGTWAPAGNMSDIRYGFQMVQLASGKGKPLPLSPFFPF